jgi:hypothetical protein
MSIGLKGNADGSGAIQIGGTDAIAIDTSQIVTMNGGTGGLVSLTSKAYNWNGVTSNTFIDFTGIPSWVKRITVMLQGVSTSGTSNLQIQLGTGATPTFTITGYLGSCGGGGNGSSIVAANFTAGFGLTAASSAAALMNGGVVITNIASNTWVAFGTTGRSDATNTYMIGGSVALGAALTAVRITTVSPGTDTFDAGSINILYE